MTGRGASCPYWCSDCVVLGLWGSLGSPISVFCGGPGGRWNGGWDGGHLADPHSMHAEAIQPLEKCETMEGARRIGQHRGGGR